MLNKYVKSPFVGDELEWPMGFKGALNQFFTYISWTKIALKVCFHCNENLYNLLKEWQLTWLKSVGLLTSSLQYSHPVVTLQATHYFHPPPPPPNTCLHLYWIKLASSTQHFQGLPAWLNSNSRTQILLSFLGTTTHWSLQHFFFLWRVPRCFQEKLCHPNL